MRNILFIVVILVSAVVAFPGIKHDNPVTRFNTDDVKALVKIKGIGQKRAQAIVQYREQHGPFKSMDDLSKVKGISKGFVKKLKG